MAEFIRIALRVDVGNPSASETEGNNRDWPTGGTTKVLPPKLESRRLRARSRPPVRRLVDARGDL